MAQWTRMVGLFTIILVVVNVATAVIFGKQLSVMQGQLDEAKATTVLTQTQLRANFRRDRIDISPVGDENGISSWDVSPMWVNTGSTSAKDWYGWFDIKVIDKPEGVPKEPQGLLSDCAPTPRPDPSFGGSVMPPGATISQISKAVSKEDAIKAVKKQSVIMIYGYIEYRDVFPNTPVHHDDWCGELVPQDTSKTLSYVSLKEAAD